MQVTIEFLCMFSATVVLISILASALISQHSQVEEAANAHREIMEARRAARAVESWMNDGMPIGLDFQEEGVSFAVEDRFLVRYGGKVIEVEGVFIKDDAEPI